MSDQKFEDEFKELLARMLAPRGTCDNCQYEGLTWFGAGDAMDRYGIDGANELLATAARGNQDTREGPDFWACPRCQSRGAIW